jgi:hypothetical protein
MTRPGLIAVACAAAALASKGRPARGQTFPPTVDRDAVDEGEDAATSPPVERAAAGGEFLPFTLAPRVGATAAVVTSTGGYDSVRGPIMASFAEVWIWGPLAVRAGAEYGEASRRVGPSIGARLQILSQRRQGLDGALSVSYRAEGFTEPEGEIETVVALGRRIGRTMAIANFAYGQDPDGHERDGEVRAAIFRPLSRRVQIGVDGQWRFDLGSDLARLAASHEATTDLDVGPVAAIALGPLALTAHAGASVVKFVGAGARAGAVALAGLGTAF